ncbi:inositol monophosphatase [Mycolicibacterium sp. P9-64]|uniref:inositol monophosphatase family protein n=1 Tax=Mycolicibacterium sp. P9-64 TaxID=2024612 RepID=UPI0011EC523B|nr:inositol monophosphatase family protein [Mycolicibacterium sp. P9-64]KAA0084669.1 inositol monophosphatase [Mycolicibacterium sp. P9-64]
MTDIDSDPESLRAVAEGLATEAAEFVRRRRTEVFGAAAEPDAGGSAVRAKSSPTDPVTIVDTETERLLRDRLAALRPGDPILGEEGGGAARVEAGRPLWVLDPIDGTVNFVYGIDGYAVSVGVQIDGASVVGAVANVPTGEVFSAALGHGAHVRRGGVSTPLRCTAVDDLAMALVGTGFGYAREQRVRQAEVLARVLPDVRDVRRLGSCALDLCMVAAGRMDAYFEDGVHVWDWAAGALIAAEAGAQLILPPVDGGESDLLIVAAAPGIAEEFEAALRAAGAFG